MSRNERDFCVPVGETFHPTLRWGSGVYTSKAITAITKAAPVAITATGHGLPNGWPCAVSGAQGMTQINATRYPPGGDDQRFGTVVDANTVEFNEVDSSNYSTYTGGGFLVFDTPTPLAGITVTMVIYSNPRYTGTALETLTSGAEITVDDTLKTITPLLQTAALDWTTGYYRLDATDSGGIVTELLRGIITIE
jgi:hypothetical protein